MTDRQRALLERMAAMKKLRILAKKIISES
jgi:hypothetical protein